MGQLAAIEAKKGLQNPEAQQEVTLKSDKHPSVKIAKARQNKQRVSEFQREILDDCDQVRLRIIAVRSKIESNICGKGSSAAYGFLTGSVDEYLDLYDAQIRKISFRLDKDKQYWETASSKLAQKQEQQESELRKKLYRYQIDLEKAKNAAASQAAQKTVTIKSEKA